MKECLQLSVPDPTPCFKKAGSIPCETEGCPVLDRIHELEKNGIEINSVWITLLLHSRCRISSLSQDNEEFLIRSKRETI